MSATRWAIGLAIAAVTAVQLTLLATDVASRNGPPDGRGQPGRTPASIQLTPDPIVIQCDGVDASTITVRITDGQGRTVPDGTIVHFDARFGFADPVEATTRHGEASTRLRLYPSARNFPGDTGVDVFTDGLRGSIGIDCAPAGPPCNPFSPPTHPASPPCEPLPCSDTDSPPVGPSPPCALPCSPFDSPPVATSPPCPFPCSTTDSPPIGTSPPCPALNEIVLDANPQTEFVETYGTFEVGETFRVSARVTQLAQTPYVGYQWAIEWPTSGLAFEDNIVEAGPSLGLSLCAESARPPVIDPAYDDAYVGGCLSSDSTAVNHVGEITEFSMSCAGPGFFKLSMIDSRVASSLQTALFGSEGALPTTTDGIVVECIQSTCGLFTSPPCVTPTPTPNCGLPALPPCAGQATLTLDVDITNGSGPCTQLDDVASISVGQSLQVAVCLLNPDGTVPMAAFIYRAAYDDRVVVAPEVPNSGLGLDDNPDANTRATTFTSAEFPFALGGGWDCSAGVGAYPIGDTDGVPQDGVGIAFSGGCGSAPGPNTLIQGPLSLITFTALSPGSTILAVFDAAVVTDDLVELGSCDPVIDFAMLCLGATIVVNDGSITATPTPAGLIPIFIPGPATATPTAVSPGSRQPQRCC